MFKKVRQIICVWRPWYWLPAISPALAIVCFAVNDGVSVGRIVLLFANIGPGICGFAESINDFYDLKANQDCKPKTFLGMSLAGGSVVILSSVKQRMSMARIAAISSLVIAFYSSLMISFGQFTLTILALLIAWLYSAPPLKAKNRYGLGLFLQALGYGPIVLGLGLGAVSYSPNSRHLLASLLIGLWVASVGMTADILDIEEDRREGCHRLTVLLGRPMSEVFIAFFSIISLFGLVAFRTAHDMSISFPFFALSTGLCIYLLLLIYFRSRTLPTVVHFWALLLETAYPFILLMRMK